MFSAILSTVLLVQATASEPSSPVIFPKTPISMFEDAPPPSAPKWHYQATQFIGQLAQALLGSFIADQSGLEKPAPDESPNDIFATRIGTSGFKVMLQGAGNLRPLQTYNGIQGNYLFTVFQGGVGAEYDFVIPDGTNHSMTVAIRFSPVYGEIALIRTPDTQLSATLPPQGVFAGSALGIEISKRFGGIEPGARAYTRTEWADLDRQDPAFSYYAAVYCRFHLAQLFTDLVAGKGKLVIMPIISYYDRGDSRHDMYSWNRAQTYSDANGLNDLRRFWEGQIRLELKF